MDEEKLEGARMYDEMISWPTRLQRETPLMEKYMHPGTLLDLACSSGRHSFDLEQKGWKCVGLDISEEMIYIANELKQEYNSSSTFVALDIASPELYLQLKEIKLTGFYDNAILVGNAIANLGSRAAATQFVTNLFLLLRPGARFISQIVYRPSNPFYMPLRETEKVIVQRIMIPVLGELHNTDLHVNRIDLQTGEYVSQEANNHFFMFTRQEYEQLFISAGFRLIHVFGGYNEVEPKDEDGATVVWVFEKPEIKLEKATIEFLKTYAAMDEKKILENLENIWQASYAVNQYRCIRDARYLFPRITSHPQYRSISTGLGDKWILDIGCNIGTDLRKLIVDGADAEKTIGVDLDERYFHLGYEFYEDKNRLSTKFLTTDLTQSGEALGGQLFDIVHAGSLLHLLSEKDIKKVLNTIFDHLSKGGVFFGRTVGGENPVSYEEGMLKHVHSVHSLREVLESSGFTAIEIITMPKEGGSVSERSSAESLSLMFVAYKKND